MKTQPFGADGLTTSEYERSKLFDNTVSESVLPLLLELRLPFEFFLPWEDLS